MINAQIGHIRMRKATFPGTASLTMAASIRSLFDVRRGRAHAADTCSVRAGNTVSVCGLSEFGAKHSQAYRDFWRETPRWRVVRRNM